MKVGLFNGGSGFYSIREKKGDQNVLNIVFPYAKINEVWC